MSIENPVQFDEWQRRKANSAYTVDNLASTLSGSEVSPESILDSYLFAKRSLAQSMQALLLSQLPASSPDFSSILRQIKEEMELRYSESIPEKFLRTPYGSKVHEVLFMLLMSDLGNPVDSSLLRTSTQDSIHTERRTRELRELGLSVESSEKDGLSYYTLVSCDLDLSVVPELVSKNIGKSKALSQSEKARLRRLLGT